MITLPNNLFIAVNIIVLAIYVIKIIVAIKNGFIYELVSLLCLGLSIWASWFLSPIMANNMSIVSLEMLDNPLIDLSNIKLMINTIIWFVILFALINILLIIIKPIFKFVSKIPVIGSVNKILGILIGVIEATIITLILSLILSTPLFTNGAEIKKGTCLTYISDTTNKLSEVVYKSVFENIVKNNDLDIDEQRQMLTDWLIEQGIFNE